VQKLESDRGDWKTYWDAKAQVPFMRNGAKWVSFDNPESLIKKVYHKPQSLISPTRAGQELDSWHAWQG
jgi:GH18 family chitinase